MLRTATLIAALFQPLPGPSLQAPQRFTCVEIVAWACGEGPDAVCIDRVLVPIGSNVPPRTWTFDLERRTYSWPRMSTPRSGVGDSGMILEVGPLGPREVRTLRLEHGGRALLVPGGRDTRVQFGATASYELECRPA